MSDRSSWLNSWVAVQLAAMLVEERKSSKKRKPKWPKKKGVVGGSK